MYFAVLFILVLIPYNVKAEIVDVNGGIKNEYTYEEVVFITGRPIIFTGTSKNVKVEEKESKGKLTETIKLTLIGPSNEKLTRSFTYVSEVTNYDGIGQSTANGEVTKYSEKIVMGGVTYTLSDYQLSKGNVTDKRPASDYFSGNALSRKTFTTTATKTQPSQTIVVNIDSRNVGYQNFWGGTETRISEYEYIYPNGTIGTVKNRASATKSRTLNYEENAASLGSFDGGYAVISTANAISEYTYDLPSKSGSIDLKSEYMPRVERLIVPKFRDLSAHWAKDEIEKLYSLGILDDPSNFFSPNTPMRRYDFAVALGKAVDLRVLEDTKKKSTTSIFKDVKRTAKDYNYLVSAVEKGVINGTAPKTFNPQGSLTREQAATILIRALGLENKAPDPGYKTRYKDDAKISDYARDAIYVAGELGLMTGDAAGKFNPKAHLSRSQASAILVRFLEYLENDLKQNYRDDILFFE
ncbi:S-layer homology domain-containing protein [Lysinibacillus yapensis]|uniref:S-layer homology domain-containing protein n=2 Tax=Ureibacillus yapensis TaxID=2304605 RepID=A0A396S470_9BACL|nr:S-layer homology domain-containing protein [Lysinibacillus yapensis]